MVAQRILNLIRHRRAVATETDPRWIPLVDSSSAVAPRVAEQVSAVFACVDVISSALASLPPSVRDAGTRRPVRPSTLDALFRRPNALQSWPEFTAWYISQALLYGNALAIIERDGTLTPVPWPSASVREATPGAGWRPDGLVYDVTIPTVSGGRQRQVTGASVLHMRDHADNLFVGRSRLQRSGQSVIHAQTLARAATAAFANGVTPSGAISVEGRLTAPQRAVLRQELAAEYQGAGNAGKVLLLDQGARWTTMDASLRDSELLDSRRFSVIEICRLFEVPPPLVQDYTNNTFTNASIAGKWFAQFTLASWASKFEATFSQLLPLGEQLFLDMGVFSRGDLGERWNAYAVALANGVLSPEEVRDLEGY